MNSDLTFAALASLLPHIPLYIAWLVAVIIAVVRWQKHPQVSALIVIAIPVMALISLAGTIFFVTMPLRMQQDGRTASETAVIMSVVGAFSALVSAGCWGLLIAAVFGWRNSYNRPP